MTPPAPMLTPLRLTPVPAKLVTWLAALLAVIVPPPVAEKAVTAAPLPARLIAPVKAMVAPVLLVRVTADVGAGAGDVAAEGDGAAGAVGDVDGGAGVAVDGGGDGDVAAGGAGEGDAGGVALHELVGADGGGGDGGAGDAGGAGGAGDAGVDPLDVDAVGEGDADAAGGAVADVRVGGRVAAVAATRIVDGGVPATAPPGSTVSPNGSPDSRWLVSRTMPPS